MIEKSKILTGLAFILLGAQAQASYYTTIDANLATAPTSIKLNANGLTNYTASFVDSSEGLTLLNHAYVRGESSFNAYTPRAFDIAATTYFDGVSHAEVLDVTSDLNGYYHLISGWDCEDEECGNPRSAIIKSSLDGIYNNPTPLAISLLDCENGYKLLPRNSGFTLYSGCGVIAQYDENGNFLNETTLGNFHVTGELTAATTPWISFEDEVSFSDITSWVGGLTNTTTSTYFQAWKLAPDGSVITQVDVPLEDDTSACQIVSGENTEGLVCASSDNFNYYTMNNTAAPVKLDVYISSGEIDGNTPWQAFGEDGHVYVNYTVVAEEVDGENVTTTYSAVVSNVDSVSGELYAYHTESSAEATEPALNIPLSPLPQYGVSPDGFLAVTVLVGEDGLLDFSLYDALTQVNAPYLTSALGAQIGTEQTEIIPITYQDEDFLPGSLSLSYDSPDAWISVDVESSEITLTPQHGDAGTSLLSLTLSNPEEESTTSLSFEALLTDYTVLMFEPVTFDLIEQDEPLPLTSLISTLGEFPVLEDDVTVFSFSLFNREDSDVDFEWGDLPSYMTWSDDDKTLTLSPAQEDVGVTSAMLQVYDVYEPLSDDGARVSRDFALNFEVIEVDEPLTITSTPVTQINVGDSYVYALTFDDEESGSSSMKVALSVAPIWMTYDSSTQSLVGQPSSSFVGTSQVQLTVQDEGGNVVVHSFTVSVNALDDESSSGGSLGWGILLLGAFAYVRRVLQNAK